MQDSTYTEDNFMELLNESSEQSRLLSMHVEREFILLAKIERLERLIARLMKNETN